VAPPLGHPPVQATLSTADHALAFLRANGAILLADGGPERPSIARAVAGTAVKGSWWSHPRARLIFQLAERLEDSGEAIVLKLVDGKVTFLHRRLWPALLRVVSDPAFRAAAERGLAVGARKLLQQVRGCGTLRLEHKAGPAKKVLEARLLVLVGQEHGPRGAHLTVLQTWDTWATPAVRREADALSVAAARALLATCGAEPGQSVEVAAPGSSRTRARRTRWK